jgi:hypothetical protein
MTVVNSSGLIQVDTNRYSVDCHYVGKAVEVRIYAHDIKVSYQETLIAAHRRCFGRYQHIYNPWHYVPILERKPGALRNGAPFKEWDLPPSIDHVREKLLHHTQGEKDFVRLLLEIQKIGLSRIAEACEKALAQGISDVGTILYYATTDEKSPDKASTQGVTLHHPPNDDCNAYNQLITQQTHITLEVNHV